MKHVVSLGRVSLGPEGFSEEVMLAEARPLGQEKARLRQPPGPFIHFPLQIRAGSFPQVPSRYEDRPLLSELLTCFVFPRWG